MIFSANSPGRMYTLVPSARFRRQVRRLAKTNHPLLDTINDVVEILRRGKSLDVSRRDHALTGKLSTFRECHIAPDWLLIYRVDKKILILELVATGTHTQLFN